LESLWHKVEVAIVDGKKMEDWLPELHKLMIKVTDVLHDVRQSVAEHQY